MHNIKIRKSDIITFFVLIVYKLFLDLSYTGFINKLYAYMGFILDFNLYKYIYSIIIFIILFIFLPKDNKKPSSIFLQLHFLIMIIPMFTIYAFMDMSNTFFGLSMSMFIMECILVKQLPSIRIVKIKNSKYILYILLAVISIFVYSSMLKANGIPSLKALNILNVYDIRPTVKYPPLMSYLVSWQAKVINPFLIATSYARKNKKILLVSISLQLLLYLITAHKSFLFIPFAILFVIQIVSKWEFFKIGSILAASGTAGLLIFYKISNLIVLPSMFLRRFLFVPALIKFYYYEFFSNNKFLYFSEGLIGKVFGLEFPYPINTANMMGDIFFNNPTTASNTGYMADAYANMGIFGMLMISLIFVFILVLIDSLSVNIGKELTVGLSIFSILALNDGALLTNLLTGGMLFLLILLYLYSESHCRNNNCPGDH